ncbi:MAG: SpaA isopeptide-forming pilin-related protein, partial [Bacteroidota bacterium]
MKVNRSLFYFFSTLIILFFTNHAHARDGENAVLIKIKDKTDQVLAGTTVHLTRVEDSVKVSNIADPEGIAEFTDVSEGTYIV